MQALKNNELDRSRYSPLVEEIKELLTTLDEFKVCWARRSANTAVHNLARVGCLNKMCKTWFSVSLDCMCGIIVAELVAN